MVGGRCTSACSALKYLSGGKPLQRCFDALTNQEMNRENRNGRLGLPRAHLGGYTTSIGIPHPIHVPIPGARIVGLVSGGWYVNQVLLVPRPSNNWTGASPR